MFTFNQNSLQYPFFKSVEFDIFRFHYSFLFTQTFFLITHFIIQLTTKYALFFVFFVGFV
jgi:hypothetical protein